MPYPAQLDFDSLVAKASEIIETEGLAQLSLSKLAKEFGVKAPSLYKYVKNKAELLRAVNLRTARKLTLGIVDYVPSDAEPLDQALYLAQAYRQFAHRNPRIYSLVFSYQEAASRPDPAELESLALMLQAVTRNLTDEENSLPVLRGLFALVHGYITLEINEQFQRGGDLDATFNSVVRAYLAGWQTR